MSGCEACGYALLRSLCSLISLIHTSYARFSKSCRIVSALLLSDAVGSIHAFLHGMPRSFATPSNHFSSASPICSLPSPRFWAERRRGS